MKRDPCARLLHRLLHPHALVYCSLGSAGRSWRAQSADQPTYFGSDPMGMALPAALGLALAQPQRPVLFIGGDGDFVMSLGCLLTIAGVAPANLKIVIFDNARYETGGGQPLAGSGRYDLPALARAAGFAWAESVGGTASDAKGRDSVDEGVFHRFLAEPGLAFLAVTIDAEASPYPPAPAFAQVDERGLFLRRLAALPPVEPDARPRFLADLPPSKQDLP